MFPSPHASSGWAVRGLGLAIVTGILVAGCSEPRMSLESWEQVWDQAVDRVARVEAPDIPEEECSEMLAYLRELRPMLDPPPVEGLQKPLDSWFRLAESAFFECPPDGETVSGWADAFERLSLLESDIAAVLARHR
ncbi:MAG: hypothetical protein KY394_04575 [Actinobacteria bacterium]|nr:hypothetical protein [Actinomycetota bacterium]